MTDALNGKAKPQTKVTAAKKPDQESSPAMDEMAQMIDEVQNEQEAAQMQPDLFKMPENPQTGFIRQFAEKQFNEDQAQ